MGVFTSLIFKPKVLFAMKLNHAWLPLLFVLSLSVFTIGCGGSEEPVDSNAPAPDVVPEADFEGEAAQTRSDESEE